MGPISMFLLLAVYQTVGLQGILATPRPKIVESFHVRSDIRFRFATTQIETVIRNTAGEAQEIFFDVTLPKEAFIVSFSMEIDGKVTNGEVKEKTEAKKEYLEAVDSGANAGHVRQTPRHSNVFDISVNVADGSAAKFTLTYQEMLRRKLGLYEHEIHVNPGQAVDDFLIEIFIQENKPLKYVKTPTLLMSERNEVQTKLITVDRPSSETAYIKYRPSSADQGDINVPARFNFKYDVEHSPKGDFMVVDGYFVNFFAPDLSPMSKDIIFILDVSGSMYGQYGKKIQQLQEAMVTILDDLQPHDRFNIILFSTEVNRWKKEIVPATSERIDEGKHFIRSINVDGFTNINSALLAGISDLKNYEDKQRVGMIFFLTDGIATVGTTDSAQIIANILNRNGNTSAIFGLAFGSEADYELLKTISAQNSGFARKIYEDSDAALQVSSLYEEISAVSIKDLSFKYLPGSVDEHTITNNEFPVIFKGSEVIVCGKISNSTEIFQLEIKGLQKSGPLDLVLTVDDVNDLIIDPEESPGNRFFTVHRDYSGIVEKMWAYQTIKQHLRKKEIHVSNKAKVEELDKKILQISMKYKFVTPLTSMVVRSSEKKIESALKDSDDLVYKSSAGKYQPQMQNSRKASYQTWKAAKSYSPSRNYVHPYYLLPVPPDNQLYRYGNGPLPMYNPFAVWTTKVEAKTLPTIPPFLWSAKTKKHTTTSGPQYTSQKMSGTSGPKGLTNLQGIVLSAIRTETKNLSLCLAPRNIKTGTYKLITSPNGAEMKVEMVCTGKNCWQILIKKIVLESNGQKASLSLDNTGAWKYQSSSDFNITEDTSDEIIIRGGGLEIRVVRIWVKRSDRYFLNIKIDSKKGYKGLIGNHLNMSAKRHKTWKRAKVPDGCNLTDIYRYINSKIAAQYMD